MQRVSNEHYKCTICNGYSAGVGAVGAKSDGYAGTDGHYEHTIHGSFDVGVDANGAVVRTPAAGTIGQLLSSGVL